MIEPHRASRPSTENGAAVDVYDLTVDPGAFLGEQALVRDPGVQPDLFGDERS